MPDEDAKRWDLTKMLMGLIISIATIVLASGMTGLGYYLVKIDSNQTKQSEQIEALKDDFDEFGDVQDTLMEALNIEINKD